MEVGKYTPKPEVSEYLPSVPPAPPTYSEAIGFVHLQLPDHNIPQNIPQGFASIPQYNYVNNTEVPNVAPVVAGPAPHPMIVMCSTCKKYVKSKVTKVPQKAAHIACFVLCLVGCCLCSCIPYCMKSFNDLHHHCPECNTFLGTYRS